MARSVKYSTGEWIVHSHFGVGQIEGVEVKNISGEETRYCRIRTSESTFWIPVDQMDSELIRPLATPKDIQQVIAALQEEPEVMSPNTKIRENQINTVRVNNAPIEIARLIRDLRARQREKGILYSSERHAYRTLRQQLVQEWAMVTGTEAGGVEAQIDKLLN